MTAIIGPNGAAGTYVNPATGQAIGGFVGKNKNGAAAGAAGIGPNGSFATFGYIDKANQTAAGVFAAKSTDGSKWVQSAGELNKAAETADAVWASQNGEGSFHYDKTDGMDLYSNGKVSANVTNGAGTITGPNGRTHNK